MPFAVVMSFRTQRNEVERSEKSPERSLSPIVDGQKNKFSGYPCRIASNCNISGISRITMRLPSPLRPISPLRNLLVCVIPE